MAQTPSISGTNSSNSDDPLAQMLASLEQQSAVTDQAAAEKMAQAQADTSQNEIQRTVEKQRKVITNATIAEGKGSRILSIGGSSTSVPLTLVTVRSQIDPETGVTVITDDAIDKRGITTEGYFPSMQKVLAGVVITAANPPTAAKPFNPQDMFTKLEQMQGPDLSAGIQVAGATLAREIALNQKRIIQQANIQSGYTDALASVQMHTAMALAKFGPTVMTIQMVEAQQRAAAARATANDMAKDMAIGDTTLAELGNAQKMLNSIETKRLNVEVGRETARINAEMRNEINPRIGQISADARAEITRTTAEINRNAMTTELEKRALITRETQRINREAQASIQLEGRRLNREDKIQAQMESITPQQTANVMAVTGMSDPDEANRVLLGTKDKAIVAASNVTPENVYEALSSNDGALRKNTLKIVVTADKAIAKDGSDATNTPFIRYLGLEKYADNPANIEKDYALLFPAEAKKLASDMIGVSTKEKDAAMHNKRTSMLATIVEEKFKRSILTDTAVWNGPQVTPDTPLYKTISSIAATDKKGVASLGKVIDNFIMQDMKDEKGNSIPFDVRQQMLISALMDTVNSVKPSFVYPDFTPMKIKLINDIKNQASRAEVARKLIDFGGSLGIAAQIYTGVRQ